MAAEVLLALKEAKKNSLDACERAEKATGILSLPFRMLSDSAETYAAFRGDFTSISATSLYAPNRRFEIISGQRSTEFFPKDPPRDAHFLLTGSLNVRRARFSRTFNKSFAFQRQKSALNILE